MVTAINRVAFFAFIAFASGLVDCSVEAQSRSQVALLVGKSASDMTERVRGQTADLAWSLKLDAHFEPSDARDAVVVGS